jgi:ABC-type sugar transport system ATPase subunit
VRLELQGVSARVGAHTHLYPTSVSLMAGAINVLLGPTLAGKTTLMRLMAGLDRPTEGKIIADGVDCLWPRSLARCHGRTGYGTAWRHGRGLCDHVQQ